MNKFIERVVKVPAPTKIAAVVGSVIALSAANWFFVIRDLDDHIASNHAKLDRLEKDLIDKKVIADNLLQYKREKEVLERKLAEALSELPASSSIDELLRQINDVGRKSGLEIVSLEPGTELPQTFYASIPIRMQVAGSYSEIAVFFEAISKLRRIVNVSQLVFAGPARKAEKVVLSANYLATTFRFIDPGEKQPKR